MSTSRIYLTIRIWSSYSSSTTSKIILNNERLPFQRSKWWANSRRDRQVVSSRKHKFVGPQNHLLCRRHPFRHGHVRFYYSSISASTTKRWKWKRSNVCDRNFFLSFSYSLVILLTILELVYFETFPMEFVCQSYFIIVVMPHVILWMNIQVR